MGQKRRFWYKPPQIAFFPYFELPSCLIVAAQVMHVELGFIDQKKTFHGKTFVEFPLWISQPDCILTGIKAVDNLDYMKI